VTESQPLVSVVVLNFNYGRWARECLDSVRRQTYHNVELIVIDDGSTDGSRSLLHDWVRANWPTTRCHLHEENRGLGVRANEALGLVRGHYYQLFSTDDSMMPGKLEAQVAVLESNPRAALCYSDMYPVDANGTLGEKTAVAMAVEAGRPPPKSGRVLDNVLAGGAFCSPSWLTRRESALAVGGYEERFYTDDVPILLRLAARYDVEYLDRPLVKYRWHGDNLSRRFVSTPAHRLLWCELLREVEDQSDVRDLWLAEYRKSVRNLIVGNRRREALQHVRHLARRDPSLANYSLLAATEVGLCDSRARRLIKLRDWLQHR
jgi:alpha-1,3-rhamnosyltransferase